jgi:transposase-like protein
VQIVLASAAGEASSEIAARVGVMQHTVATWRRWFHTQRLAWLSDALKP